MNPDSHKSFQRTLRHRDQVLSNEVINERIHLSKRIRGGHLGSITRIRGQIEILLSSITNTQTVQTLAERYESAWLKFEEAHNQFISLVSPHSSVFYQAVEQYNKLHVEKAAFSQRLSVYLQDYIEGPSHYQPQIMTTSATNVDHTYAESVTSHRSNVSRESNVSSRSSVQEKRAQAAKAKLALQLAEEERRRMIEGELKLLEIEKKQRELERQQKLEEEELHRLRKIETLKQETDRNLAEVRQQAALMDLEAALEEQIDNNEVVDMDLVSQDEVNISGDIPFTYFYEDEVPEQITVDLPKKCSFHEVNPVSSTPASQPSQLDASLAAFRSNLAKPAYSWSARVPSYQAQGPRANATIRNLVNPKPQYTQSFPQSHIRSHEFGYPPVSRPVPEVPSASWSTASNMSFQGLHTIDNLPPETNPRSRIPNMIQHLPNPDSVEPPCPRYVQPTDNSNVLHSVASAMQNISMVQQRLASNLNLPAIHLEIFYGLPSEFPMFKQRFEKRILSRSDFDDGEKMLRLLQFLGGEAKEAVKSFEAVQGGVYEAMKVLEKRYGRKCLVVSSIVECLTKGPSLPNRDSVALRKFADKAASANATLRSLDCLQEINQGNLIEMSRRLPKYLQEKFAVVCHELETKQQRFPTLSDFAAFLDKWANVANHPVNVPGTEHPNFQGSSKGKKPKFTLFTQLPGMDGEIPYKRYKISSCLFCSQTHPIYRCEQFKGKTPDERFEFAKKKNLCFNCLKNNPIIRPGGTVKHTVKSCPSKFKCKVEGCGASHHTLLHKPKPPQKPSENEKIDNQVKSTNTATSNISDAVLLQVIPVRVIGEQHVVTTYAMLDSGSEITLVDPSLVEQVGAQGRPDKLAVSTVSNESDLQHGYRVNLSVESIIDENPQRLKLTNAWSSK